MQILSKLTKNSHVHSTKYRIYTVKKEYLLIGSSKPYGEDVRSTVSLRPSKQNPVCVPAGGQPRHADALVSYNPQEYKYRISNELFYTLTVTYWCQALYMKVLLGAKTSYSRMWSVQLS